MSFVRFNWYIRTDIVYQINSSALIKRQEKIRYEKLTLNLTKGPMELLFAISMCSVFFCEGMSYSEIVAMS